MVYKDKCPVCGSSNVFQHDMSVTLPVDETVQVHYLFHCMKCNKFFNVREPYVWTGKSFIESEED